MCDWLLDSYVAITILGIVLQMGFVIYITYDNIKPHVIAWYQTRHPSTDSVTDKHTPA